MKLKTFRLLFLILCLGASAAFAQTPDSAAVKTISKGVVNGSALSLAKPAYPPAAKAVGAEGTVSVQATIDEEGNVVAAEAQSGHPLLRAAAVEAARQSKFKPTLLNGQAVRVTGIIVYNFVADRLNWFRVGQQLTSLEKIPTPPGFEPAQFEKFFPTEWTFERQLLERLSELKKANPPADLVPERVVAERTVTKPDGTRETVKTVESRVRLSGPPSPEQVTTAQNLIAAVQSRLAASETDSWDFNLGLNLSRAVSFDDRDAAKRQAGADIVNNFIQSAPSGTSPELVAELTKLSAILSRPAFTPETRDEIGKIMTNISRFQSVRR